MKMVMAFSAEPRTAEVTEEGPFKGLAAKVRVRSGDDVLAEATATSGNRVRLQLDRILELTDKATGEPAFVDAAGTAIPAREWRRLLAANPELLVVLVGLVEQADAAPSADAGK